MLFWKDFCQADQQSAGRHGRTVSIIPEEKLTSSTGLSSIQTIDSNLQLLTDETSAPK